MELVGSSRRSLLRLLLVVLLAAAAHAAGSSRPGRLAMRASSGVRSAIVGGSKAVKGRYPWAASLRVNNASSWHFCGGSLIAPRVVMTAAHCLIDYDGAWSSPEFAFPQVRLGGYERDGGAYELRQVTRACVHEDYNADTNANDVALLFLDAASNKTAIKLPLSKPDPPVGQGAALRAIGWGRLSYEGAVPSTLMEVGLDFVSDCTKYIDQSELDKSMICAGSPKYAKDACQGDSGGSLFVKGASASSDRQIGIVSWGYGCAAPTTPGVYTDVAFVSAWVRQKMAQLMTAKAMLDEVKTAPSPTPSPRPSPPPSPRPSPYGCRLAPVHVRG